jgi:hypothetical protein
VAYKAPKTKGFALMTYSDIAQVMIIWMLARALFRTSRHDP